MEELKKKLKEVIVRSLRTNGVDPNDLADTEPLVGGKLEVDSVDILQLIVDIEREFGIKLVAGRFERSIWENVETLAAAIRDKTDTCE